MTSMGFRVMVHHLFGSDNEMALAYQKSLNKVIQTVDITHDSKQSEIALADKTKFVLWDDGQSCCESRYMTCDDDLSVFVGSTFLGAEIRQAPSFDCEYGVHDVEFLIIKTSRGDFTIANHNEHNGYYGGFAINGRVDNGLENNE